MRIITETKNKTESHKNNGLEKIYESSLKELLKQCYQCGRCSSVCQLSKVQKFAPSRIIQLILEGFEDKLLESGVLWDCLTCNSCLQNCPKNINFSDIVRVARYKMIEKAKQNPDELIAHKGFYTTLSEIMSQRSIKPQRDLSWIPKECKISDKGTTLYYVGCLPYFNYEFENQDSIAKSTLKILSKIENEPIVLFKDEICCGHDIYWGQGKIDSFIELGKKNVKNFEAAGVTNIITACAECYRTFKVDYSNIFEGFKDKFKVQHIIEYVYDNWKHGKIKFTNPNDEDAEIQFTFHDPCRLSRFLPKDNMILEKGREIFAAFKELRYDFKEMTHNRENSLCCGVSSWLNCNEKSKALRYKRMLEAKSAGTIMVTSCPKCRIHFNCLKHEFEDIASIKIFDFSEFLADHIEVIDSNKKEES